MQRSYPGINPSISAWKGQEIVDFQEELFQTVKARISEKWFYTHVKSDNDTLPRIDVLNLLSKYAGYVSWDDFRYKQTGHPAQMAATKSTNRVFIYLPLMVLFLSGIFFVSFKLLTTRKYSFVFYDAYTREPIVNSLIEISVLQEGESPLNYLARDDGSFELKTGKANVRIVVQSPYYLSDTVFRILNKFNRNEMVRLEPNNFALILYYLSNLNVEDWEKRMSQMDRMISDSALIYQVHGKEEIGLELYNKWEFMNKLSLPSRGLKGIEILDTRYLNDQISLICFRQKETDK